MCPNLLVNKFSLLDNKIEFLCLFLNVFLEIGKKMLTYLLTPTPENQIPHHNLTVHVYDTKILPVTMSW